MSVRYPAVAGAFYDASPDALRDAVTGYLDGAKVEPAPDRVAALIAPHAGFIYSGATAGNAFARVRGKRVGRVVLLGRSHRHQFEGAAVPAEDCFETPLGGLPVDRPFIKDLDEIGCVDASFAHAEEHCLEVLLPFVQVALGETPIVPILFGTDPKESHVHLGEHLAGMLDPHDLVVASTDLSHYLPDELAHEMDKTALDHVLHRDFHALIQEADQGICSMCGATAVVCAMACSLERGAYDWRLLDHSTSARASGDHSRVVGYGAISMEWSN